MEVKIGNRYIKEFCSLCKKETTHRVYRRFGKSDQGKGKGRFRIRRIVTYCLKCGKRRIDKPNKRRRSAIAALENRSQVYKK